MKPPTSTEAYIGRPMPRKEDRPLLTGRSRFVADIALPGALEVAFLRSTVAHARISGIDAAAARDSDGVVGIYTAEDLAGSVEPFTRFVDQERTPPELTDAAHPTIRPCDMEVLASQRVRYVGQPVAAVVAESRYLAEDAVDLIGVDYKEVQAVTDPEAATAPGAPTLHEQVPGNVQASFEVDVGDVEAAFAGADHTTSFRFRVPRVAACPIETRGVLAAHGLVGDELTVWSSTQTPYMVRTRIAEMLGLAEQRVRVAAPDVGGGRAPGDAARPARALDRGPKRAPARHRSVA